MGLAVALLFLGSQSLQNANANGDTRTISLFQIHTKEELTITYKKNGRYDEEALKKLNWYLRDWRKEQEVKMDPSLIDMMWEVHREVGAKGPIHIVCGYRSPDTNAMLRRRSGGVARFSQHMLGKAIDFSIPSADVSEVRAAALRIQGGGVGYYPTSGIPFVHMDIGSVRHWPRMTRDQLVRVFPNGRTVHVPSDGNPLPGYELALADVERGTARRPAGERSKPRSLMAALFGGGAQDEEEVGDTASSRQQPAAAPPARRTPPAPAPTTVAAAPEATVTPPETKAVPLPLSRPTFEIASAESRPAPAPRARNSGQINVASASANDVITMRGYWQGLPDAAQEALAAAPPTSVSAARRTNPAQVASADADVTASVGPFQRNDRVPSEVALSYAAQGDVAASRNTQISGSLRGSAPAVVAKQETASVASRPVTREPASPVRAVKAGERLDDPWLRGVVMAPSVQNSMVTTVFGAPDFRNLRPFIQKPASSVMMTFSADPHLGMTTDQFTGSAIVFQATVTYGMRTAALR